MEVSGEEEPAGREVSGMEETVAVCVCVCVCVCVTGGDS